MAKKTSPDSVYERKDAAYWRMVHATAFTRLAQLRADRDALDAQLEQLSREILQLEKVVASLEPLTSNTTTYSRAGIEVEGIEQMGLADACREILKQKVEYRTARGVRDSLAASGYDLEQHSNPLASIHGVLKRLAESGDVEELESEGKTRYRWKKPIPNWGQRLVLPTVEADKSKSSKAEGIKPRSETKKD